jgi:hypothetical protein
VAAILGLDRFRDAMDVYLDKTRPPPEEGDGGVAVDLLRGQLLEPVAADLYERDTGRRLRRMGQRRHPKLEWAAVHADRQILAGNGRGTGLLELKCPRAGTVRRIKEEGLFPSYMLQTQWGMMVCGYEWGSIGVMNLETEPPLLHVDVEFGPAMSKDVVALMRQFWHDHVLTLVAPDPVQWGSWGREVEVPPTDSALQWVDDPEAMATITAYANAKAVSKDATALLDEGAEALRELMAGRGWDAINSAAGKVYHRWQDGKRSLPRERLEAARVLDYALVVDALTERLGAAVLDTDPEAVLAGCELDLSSLERVGEPYRTLRFYPAKEATS